MFTLHTPLPSVTFTGISAYPPVSYWNLNETEDINLKTVMMIVVSVSACREHVNEQLCCTYVKSSDYSSSDLTSEQCPKYLDNRY